jgi:tripartite-type tricarboxylate transporter receptor subunit TctC
MKAVFILVALLATNAIGQTYPSKPVRVIVPFPPGGTADLLSRTTAQKLAASLGQQFIVESRAGAGGNLGAEYVYRAEPDGYTLLATPPHILTVNPLLYRLAFDPTRFVPVGIIAAYPNVLLATPRFAPSTLDELVAQARQNPGRINIASQGSGTISHLSAELLKSLASINLTHVPYKGTAPAMTDLLGGQVELMFDNLITAMPHVKAGKLKILGVGGAKRVAAFPDVPAIAERLPGFHSETWMAYVAPPGTPMEIAARLSTGIARAVREPDFQKLLTDLQAEPVGNTPSQMADVVRQELERWGTVIREARITVQ